MRITLVFPPPASPTYVPLGVASLVSHIRATVPRTDVSVCDFNVALWSALAHADACGQAMWTFMQESQGSFLDPASYANHQGLWGILAEKVAGLSSRARSYVETGCCSPELGVWLDDWTDSVWAEDPEVVGVSVMFLDQMPFALALARRLSEQRDRRGRVPQIVFGGAAMTALNVDEMLRAATYVDAALPGEGEQAVALLCQGVEPAGIPGMRTVSTPLVASGTTQLPLALESVGPPDFGLFDLGRYANPTPVLPVVMSRDCSWRRCRFCAHNFSFGGYRAKPVAQIVGELDLLMSRHGAGHFYFADQYISAQTLEELSDEILRRNLTVRFHLMGRPTRDHTPKRLAKAAAAGCRWISWGIETGSQRLLNLVRKGTRREDIERLLEHTFEAGIANLMMMIFGLPTSTEADLAETFDLIERVYHQVAAIKSSSFVLFDGTAFAAHPHRFGLAVTGRQELLRMEGRPIHTSRLNFMARATDGSLMPPPGPVEVSRWMQRRRWLGDLSFLETLCCEHFLLYTSAAAIDTENQPHRPLPRRAA